LIRDLTFDFNFGQIGTKWDRKLILKTVLRTRNRKFEIEDFFVFKTINGAISDPFRSKMVNITSTALISKVFHRNADF